MSKRRETGTPGRELPAMQHVCGEDGGYDGAPICGKPAVYHLFAGSPETGPSDWSMMSCEEHFPTSRAIAWDYHPIGAICDLPGSLWQSVGVQGEGFCFWPAAEEIMHESVTALAKEDITV